MSAASKYTGPGMMASCAVLQSYGSITPEKLKDAQQLWNSRSRTAKRRTFLQLFLDPEARAGQPVNMLDQVSTNVLAFCP